jgi:hypothetical protein
MKDLMQYARTTRTVLVAHAEAFQLMRYEAKGQPPRWFWNSRDGVTPFGTVIDGIEYRHAMNSYIPSYSAVLPDAAEFVWVSHTPETWLAMYCARWDLCAKDGPFDIRVDHPDREAWAASVPFEHGQPRQLSRAEYLAATPEWMGRYAGGEGRT